MSLASRLVAAWYAQRLTVLTAPLVPFAAAFAALASARRALFRLGVLHERRLPVPVVVVGNITVGGSGKTPLAAALTRALAERGWHPGIVSRGHGGSRVHGSPIVVAPDSDAREVGDEPVLLVRTGIPVVVAADRVAAARALIEAHPQCDVIVADDGLQHYRLARNFEIVVVDAARGLGNGWRLPAGPLREPAARLEEADAIVALVTQGSSATSSAALPIRRRRSRRPPSRAAACTPSRASAIRSASLRSCARSGLRRRGTRFPITIALSRTISRCLARGQS